MNVYPPHRPVHESEDFWYYPKEAVLLYENEGEPRPHNLEAKHSEQGRREHGNARMPWDHLEPHGVRFKDAVLQTVQQEMNAANVELVVRLCYELGLTRKVEETQRTTFLLAPKFLAFFLEAKRTCMHKEGSLTQALILIQTKALSVQINATH